MKKEYKTKEFWFFLIGLIILLELGYAISDYIMCPCK